MKEAEPSSAVPFEDWPLWAIRVRTAFQAGEAGVGDTIERQLGVVGMAFKASLAALGFECGCAGRRDELNRRYPYAGQG